MSTKLLSRPRKQRQKDEMKHEIVAQVHKTIKKEQGADKENINKIESEESSSRSGSNSNRTFLVEDKNDNYNLRTPSRDVSVDEETQINSKILSLIETEMKRDINKHSHFTDSRPQSLSFYEDEKIPEELSGNLELLSPEERRHYRRRKEYIDLDMERNVYNNLQDALNRENDDIINGPNKKSKSRKKKHSGDPELGLGDSREMMIPKEKRKSKKKKRESSPMSSNSSRRKHRKRDEDFEPKNDITLALEELQDDVFENGADEFVRSERIKKSPRKSDKLYVQRKNKFELTRSGDSTAGGKNNMASGDREDFSDYHPIDWACCVQKHWLSFTLLCHGFLGGIALFHYIFIYTQEIPEYESEDVDVDSFARYIDVYTCLFYFLCVICIISVFDRYDLSHVDVYHLRDLMQCKKSVFVVLIYIVCLICNLAAVRTDDKLGIINYHYVNNYTSPNITVTLKELTVWKDLSYWRAGLAITGWIVLACITQEDLFYIHLKNMVKYATDN